MDDFVFESYLIPAMELSIKPPKELKEYQDKSVDERIRIWIKHLESHGVEIEKKLLNTNKDLKETKLMKIFGTISKKIEVDGYEMVLYTSKKDPNFKNPKSIKLYIKGKYDKRFVPLTYDIRMDPNTTMMQQQMIHQQQMMNQMNFQNQMLQQQIQNQQIIDQHNMIHQQHVQMHNNFAMTGMMF